MCAAANESVIKNWLVIPTNGTSLASKAMMRNGATAPALSRIVSPATTEGDGSKIDVIDAGPFGADISTHANPTTAAAMSNDVAIRRFTRGVRRRNPLGLGKLVPRGRAACGARRPDPP